MVRINIRRERQNKFNSHIEFQNRLSLSGSDVNHFSYHVKNSEMNKSEKFQIDKKKGKFQKLRFLDNFLNQIRDKTKNKKTCENSLLLLLGILIGTFHFWNSLNLFESATQFSKLSSREREISLPLDIASRYIFYKKIASADSFSQGLASIFHDNRTIMNGGQNNFQASFLYTEILISGCYHLLKSIMRRSRKKEPIFSSSCLLPITTLDDKLLFINENEGEVEEIIMKSVRSVKMSAQNEISSSRFYDSKKIDSQFLSRCTTGLQDSFYFYFYSISIIESSAIILLLFSAYKLSNSFLGAIGSGLLYILSHPQKSSPEEWLFPSHKKVEWATFVCHSFFISSLVFKRKTHPPWITTLKISIATAVMILISKSEAQWFLTAQIITIALMHIFSQLSAYRASLIIFGHLTGWQYASLVSFEAPTVVDWSIFFPIFFGVFVAIFLVKPVIDWILGAKRKKWNFMRATFQIISLQMTLFIVFSEMEKKLNFPKDERFSFDSSEEKDLKIEGKNELPSSDDLLNKSIISILFSCSYQFSKLNLKTLVFSKYFFHFLGLIYYAFILHILDPFLSFKKTGVRDVAFETNSDEINSSCSQYFLIKREKNSLITHFNVFLIFFYIIYSVALDKRWELLLASQLSIILSLLFNHQKLGYIYGKLSSFKLKVSFSLHWGIIFSLLLALSGNWKLSTEKMLRNSKSQYSMVSEFIETLEWIESEMSIDGKVGNFIGLNSLVIQTELGTNAPSVTHHHLPYIYSFYKQNSHKSFKIYREFENVIVSETDIIRINYSIFRNDLSISDFVNMVRKTNASHYILSKEACNLNNNDNEMNTNIPNHFTTNGFNSFSTQSQKCTVNRLQKLFLRLKESEKKHKNKTIENGERSLCSDLMKKNTKFLEKVFENSKFIIFHIL